MASNGPIPSYQSRTSQYHCNECGVYFDSAQSLDVHLQYHKENLLTKWANQAASQQNGNQQQQAEEANNNTTTKIKRELITTSLSSTIAAPADSSDTTLTKSNNRSPDSCNSSATPDISVSVGHPATPQSYHSAPSPYQNPEPTNFSPNFHNFHVKTDGSPPTIPSTYPGFNHHNMHYADSQYFGMDQTQLPSYHQDYLNNKQANISNSYRYHPYQQASQFVERSAQVTSSSSNQSPSYPGQTNPPQPTPSPSPKQCDKCGFVCETAGQLVEHLQIAHPSAPFSQQHQTPFPPFPGSNHNHGGDAKVKQEDEPQAEILDLDSQKVHVYQTPEEQEDALKRQQAELAGLNGANHNPHSVSAMLSWPNSSTAQQMQQQQQKMFHQSANNQDNRMFNSGSDQKMYNSIQEEKMYSSHGQEQKLFQPHQMHNSDFHPNNVTTTTQHDNVNPNMGVPQNMAPSPQIPHPYRPYEHIPVQPNPPVISSTQVPNQMPPTNLSAPVGKGSTWKSNEARRPKTYNCSACNKWFTSSGHLKRHYNTTLHKNAVKSSGQPDPATLPISAHHHPSRDPNHANRQQQHNAQQQSQQQSQQQQSHDVNSQSPASLHLPTPGPDEPNSDNGDGLGPAYDSRSQHSGLLQQPPSGPYDRHPPNIGGGPLHNNLAHSPNLSNSLTNLSTGSPPNGEAGPSVDLSRGLQSISTSNIPPPHQLTPPLSQLSNIPPSSNHLNQLPPFNLINQPPQHMMGTPNQIFHHPMGPPTISTNYPNELSPHVTQTMLVTNSQQLASISLTSTGELSDGPLPSFAQFALLAGLQPVQISSVGGSSSVTDSQHPGDESHSVMSTSQMFSSNRESEFILPDDGPSGDSTVIKEEAPDDYETAPIALIRPNNSENEFAYHESHQAQVLQPVDQNVPHEKVLVYSPTNNNHNLVIADVYSLRQQREVELINEAAISPKLKENDLETSSPLITSTGSPLSVKKQTQKTPGGIHKCIDCDKVFNKACYLTQHNKTFHSGDKPFKCHRCGKRFSDDDGYQAHLKKHAGEKPHKCEQCPKQFNHKTDLRRHMCLHSGFKPYACDTCGKGFIRKDHMIKHCDTHIRKSKLNKDSLQLSDHNAVRGNIMIAAFQS